MVMPVFAHLAPLAVAAELVLLAVLAVALLLGAAAGGAWRTFGKEPRRSRANRRARELLAAGDWRGARRAIEEIRAAGISTPEWAGRVNNLEGECQRRAGDEALAAGKYEEALALYLDSAKLLGLNRDEASAKVIEGMTEELRALVARPDDDAAARQAERILQVQAGHAEASFWLGLVRIRQHRPADAEQALRAACEGAKGRSVEPTLYLGMHLLREGRAKEGLKLLAEANRLAGNSVVVTWQLGMGLAAGGGDTALAIRALQKSLAADGLPRLAREPERFWQQAFPDESYIARLAAKHPFVCPVLGGSVAAMIRQAKLTLGQALERAGRVAEAAAVFQDLINEGEPTPAMLRALGAALCRLGRYDEAYPHLRAAHEQDAAKNPLTTCYLAFAAAKAKPKSVEDRPANARWAVRLLSGLAYPVEAEPARLVAAVFAEARAIGQPVPADDLQRVCDTFVALDVADADSAAAVDHLAATAPDALRPPHAFLYGRAAAQHACRGANDLDLLARVFPDRGAADAYYRERGWDLGPVERLFLERWSEQHSGFPEVLGPDYPARAERALLEQARKLEEAGKLDEARTTVGLLCRLIPANAASLDHLARLAWHQGEVGEAARLLQQWAEQAPAEPTPHLRLAVVEQQHGDADAAAGHVRAAYDKSVSAEKAAAALLGAKLALRDGRAGQAVDWLNACLGHEPGHAEALTLLAALRWNHGDQARLAELAGAMKDEAPASEYRYMGAVARLAAGDLDGAREFARPLLEDAAWKADAWHLLGVIEQRRGDPVAAAAHLAAAAEAGDGPLVDHARALLGRTEAQRGHYAAAAGHWLLVPEPKRRAWGIADHLAGWAYLAGVQALRESHDAAACDWLGRAREQGQREPRLSVLQERAAVAASRRVLAGGALALPESLLPALDRAARSHGPLQPLAAVILARARRRADHLPEAREALRRLGTPPAAAVMELGLVALQDRQLSQAEECFARVLQEQPDNAAARHNLFWARLSLGRPADARELLPGLIEATASLDERRLLTQLQIVMKGGPDAGPLLGDMTADEEQRLIAALFAVSDLEVTVPWLCVLAGARSHSPPAREAQAVAMIRLGKQLFDRGDWLGCEKWLAPLAKARPLASVRNLLGCCLCLQQDFAGGVLHLQEALRLAGDDPRLHQNLALAFAWMGEDDESDLCWGRYLGTFDQRLPRPPGFIDYHERLRFHVLRQLGNQAYERERWNRALAYLAEAHRFEPDNVDLGERLFLLQVQAGDRAVARQTLSHLQSLRPRHPTFELYELDLIEVRGAADLERLLDTLAAVVERLADDPAAQERAVTRVLPQLQARADQLTRVLREVRDDLQRLPEDSAGWYDALRDLRGVKKDLRRLRQVVRYGAALQVSGPTLRKLDALTDELERRIDYCRRWEEVD